MEHFDVYNKIEVPQNLDKVIIDTVQIGNCRRKKRTVQKISIAVAGVAAAFVLCFCVGMGVPSVAQAMQDIPVIGKVFQYLYDLEDYDGRYNLNAADAKPLSDKSEMVSAENLGIKVMILEYYCDENSLFLSVQIVSEEPFYEEKENDSEIKEGMLQLFGKVNVRCGENILEDVGSGSLNVEGVYLDAHTFVGVAKEEAVKEEADTMQYEVNLKHVKAYLMGDGVVADVRGVWNLDFEVEKEGGTASVIPVRMYSPDKYGILDVKVTPYEIYVSVTPDSNTAYTSDDCEEYQVLVFKEDGTMLKTAEGSLNAVFEKYDTWFFANEEGVETITIYVVNREKWLDEWQGESGQETMEFLEKNCYVTAQVSLK